MSHRVATSDLVDFLISITLREGEARESWRAVDQHEVEKIKKTPIAKWGFGASELIETAEKVVKVCKTLTLVMSIATLSLFFSL